MSLHITGVSVGFQPFQDEIPNGHNVPNPCGEGTWQGVGHLSIGGSGDRNGFGSRFKDHGFVSELPFPVLVKKVKMYRI